MAKLVFLHGVAAGRFCELGPGRTTIGRAELNGLVISDPSVSRIHCELLISKDGVAMVRDLGSTNGTFVAGRRLEGAEVPISSGELLQVGEVAARFETEADVSGVPVSGFRYDPLRAGMSDEPTKGAARKTTVLPAPTLLRAECRRTSALTPVTGDSTTILLKRKQPPAIGWRHPALVFWILGAVLLSAVLVRWVL